MLSAPALAADPSPPITARLEYVAPRGCPPASVLGAEFARRMGYDPFVESSPLRVVAIITREKNMLAGSLSFYDSDGTQVWSNPYKFPAWQCLDLVQFMAGALAVRFDPKMRPVTPVEAPPPPPPPPPLPAPSKLEPEAAPAALCPPRPVVTPPPAPPKRRFRLVAGFDGVFTSFIAPSAGAGVDLWAGIDLADRPFSFELDLRLIWSLTSVAVPIPYQPHFAVRSSYTSGVVAGCLRLPVSICALLEIGSMSFAKAVPHGDVFDHSAVVAVGGRGAYDWHLGERFLVRGLVELEGLVKPASLLNHVDQPLLSPRWFSLSGGVGFVGSL